MQRPIKNDKKRRERRDFEADGKDIYNLAESQCRVARSIDAFVVLYACTCIIRSIYMHRRGPLGLGAAAPPAPLRTGPGGGEAAPPAPLRTGPGGGEIRRPWAVGRSAGAGGGGCRSRRWGWLLGEEERRKEKEEEEEQ